MKRGFSIIELIVSIVIIGIVFLSVPTILLQTAQNNESSIIQQSVMDTKTRLALILKAPWGCTNNANLVNLATPIFGNNLQNFYTQNAVQRNSARTFSGIARNTPCLAGQEQDLNSFNGDQVVLAVPATDVPTYRRDGIINETLNTTVATVDMTGINNNDIREITITTTALIGRGANNPVIVLRAYSSNIGDSPALDTRTW